jgi:photosystem II stability/assembly factor-like uncharacterized protein
MSRNRESPIFLCALLAAALAPSAHAQRPARSQPRRTLASAASNPATPRFKAIWEPVNVKEDLKLMSVHFVAPEEGWVAGGRDELNGGVILHTRDGGAAWETQLGDPQSSDRAYVQLRFLGPTLGWAAQTTGGGDHNLLRTTDGQNWAVQGTVAQHRTDYQFTSAGVGFVASGDAILRTQDGGQHWQPAYRCRVQAEVNGLTREMSCEFEKIFFLSSGTGYAISRGLGGNAGFVLAKTTDGGDTWQASVILPGVDGKEGGLWFTSDSHGVLRSLDGRLFYTDDGGKTWTGASGRAPDGRPEIQFADAGVGWMVHYQTMTYTTDGGRHWVSRQIAFPAPVAAFSLASRSRGYAVGEHGMVYRYRIVPIEYVSKGMLSAPAMPK